MPYPENFQSTRWTKKSAYKTGSFLLFSKIVKKLIITGISIIILLSRNEKPFYGELIVFFFKKLKNKGKDLISICSNVDVNGCFDFFYLFLSVCVHKRFLC